jgi:hypothetical protein
MQRGRIKACLAESLMSLGALTAGRQSARIARLNAAASLSACSATTIIRRTDVQRGQPRPISGIKNELKQRSFSYRHRALSKKAGTVADLTLLKHRQLDDFH